MKNTYYQTTCPSPVGTLTLASDGDSLAGLWIEGQKYFGGAVKGEITVKDDLPVFDAARKWLDQYFAGARPDPAVLPLAPAGSEFRKRVWKQLCMIPYGKTVSYGQIASLFGPGTSYSQAVGSAVGRNPISIIIPCHRVVGTNGSLTGYAGGIDKKIWLLRHEGADMEGLTPPKE